ncbi:ABC transporter substrate-binding protein [Actinospica sp.]|uniref:ABC transporter substrate-binding protein n=1 Tax=Actinospica sp. TaxID=1872142 RepID=UPI002C54FD9C|nr:ABC transporter substrate-binding protein [Actinospica sp.]HWG25195.1 ABC transporter substrate-binding protein [Actinospica sp.]
MTHPSRRRVLKSGLGAGLGLGAIGLLGACSATVSTADASSSASGGPWTFIDDRGAAVRLDSAPTKVVAYTGTAAALYDFGVTDRIVGVFGPTRQANGKADPMAGNLPVDKLTVLGNAYGEFDVAKYAELNPQLLITDMWEKDSLWYVPAASLAKIEKLAPTIGITVASEPLTTPLAHYEKLAGLLGADLTASAVVTAKTAFQQAVEQLRSAAKSKSTITVMAASASADLLYISNPKIYPDLSYFEQLGVSFIRPTNVVGGFFESLSWENAGRYQADVILLDDRTGTLQPADLTGKATWTALPAVRADQIVSWNSESRYSYTAIGPIVQGFADALRNAKKVA